MNIKLNNTRVNPMIHPWSSKKWVLPNALALKKQLYEQGNQNESQLCPLRLLPDTPWRRACRASRCQLQTLERQLQPDAHLGRHALGCHRSGLCGCGRSDDGHMGRWALVCRLGVALWAVAFAAVGLFAGVSKTMAIQMKQGLDEWSARMAQSRSDERLWAIAQTDARLMSELQTAMSRSDEEELLGENSTQRRVARMLQNRQYYI